MRCASGRACDNCRFWGGWSDGHGHGDCRRHAPVVYADTDTYASGIGTRVVTRTAWPRTHAGQLCGDYAPTTNSSTPEET